MFEWRIFKKLPSSTLDEFEGFLNTWKKNLKTQSDYKVDAYVLLPPLFQELNWQQKFLSQFKISQFGLKLKSSKLRLNSLKCKLKGYKLELCERTKRGQNGFELWNKTIEKTMKKKAKIHLETFVVYNCKKNSQILQQQQLLLQQTTKQQVNVFQTKILDDRQLQKESRFLVDQQELNEFLKKLLKTIKKKIQKYKIDQVSLNEYVSILEQCLNDQQISIVIVEKFPAIQNEQEECPFRLRVVQQKVKEMDIQQTLNQFYITASIHQYTENIHIIEEKIKEWKQKYEIPNLEFIQGEQLGGEFFIGGFPEFLAQFSK